MNQNTAYDMIDRFIRNNLDDDDYAEYSAALDAVYGDAEPQTNQYALGYKAGLEAAVKVCRDGQEYCNLTGEPRHLDWFECAEAIEALPIPDVERSEPMKECRHCGFLCKPNEDTSNKYYPLEQSREWRDLTDDELKAFHHIEEFGLFCDVEEFIDITRAVIAKFKEKQNA